jgi:hypothetical protein
METFDGINLPSDHVIGFMIAVGKKVKPAMPKAGQLARRRAQGQGTDREGAGQ